MTKNFEPFIIMDFEFAGPESDAAPFLAPFIALDPVALTNVTTPYTNLAHASASGVTDPVCQFGGSKRTFPVGLLRYNVTTNRALYELFSKMLADHPGLNNSIVQFEGYSMQGVQAVDPASTAYAHREDNLLLSVLPLIDIPLKIYLRTAALSQHSMVTRGSIK